MANPLGRGKAKQATSFTTPELNNHHLGCGKPSLPSWDTSSQDPPAPVEGSWEGTEAPAPPELCRGMLGAAAGGAATVVLGREPAGEPQPHEIMKCQTNPCIFHSLSGHLPD